LAVKLQMLGGSNASSEDRIRREAWSLWQKMTGAECLEAREEADRATVFSITARGGINFRKSVHV